MIKGITGVIASGQRRIIQSGLVYHYDFSSRVTYPGTGVIVNDLSPTGATGEVLNGAGFNTTRPHYFEFDGVDDRIYTPEPITLSGNATFMAWIYWPATQGKNVGLIYSRSSTVNGFKINSNDSLGYIYNTDVATWNWLSGPIVPKNIWNFVCVTVSPTQAIASIRNANGVLQATNTTAHTATVIMDDTDIGADRKVGRYFAGNIAMASMYNRTLSPTEVVYNYDITKNKFV
jgi:hypothetical protein